MKRHQDEPFAILGVNTDDDKDVYREKAEELGVTWRSAWQGSTSGPITSQWRVNAYPTIHVIDGKGRIRYMNVRGQDLDEAVEVLLHEMREQDER